MTLYDPYAEKRLLDFRLAEIRTLVEMTDDEFTALRQEIIDCAQASGTSSDIVAAAVRHAIIALAIRGCHLPRWR